ncbi:enoyl-CoA hydratase [Xenophilus arseniciresistens]|uniref:Enoyl-CoA hydratase n=1 Tax=Xenophilus arseniciresistens TaxID=1283306 RepID=A0AAE3NCP7_9BURK|nr:enoyl-CoA hydratase [Xenophilus arseniciresistens]MDA7418391.1 enoyl-CoA hydratase [Xenophilus arseniciresistens]
MSQADCVELTLGPQGVAQIVVNRPQQHNAMSMPMYGALLAHLQRCAQEPSVRAVLFKGTGGKSFISGTDISHFADFESGEQGLRYEAHVEEVVGAVERLGVPTIAVVQGWAVGGGLAIATACDFRLCSEGSQFGAPIAKTLSNTLSARNIARLVAAFGVPRVKRMLMLAEYLSAPEALACGYVLQVCEGAQLDDAAQALAQRLIGLSSVTQMAVKESLRRLVQEHSLADDDLVQQVYGSQAFRDGVARFNGAAGRSRRP